jgi:hypothetical protein
VSGKGFEAIDKQNNDSASTLRRKTFVVRGTTCKKKRKKERI